MIVVIITSLTTTQTAISQNGVLIAPSTGSADPSAMLEVRSTLGFLAPRMLSTDRTAISSPATGLLVFQTDAPAGFYYYNGSSWQQLSTAVGSVTSITAGSGLSGGSITSSGTIAIASGGVTNAMLANSSLTVTAGTGMSGGGSVSLGGTITLTNSAPDQIVVLNNGTGISVSGTYPNFTITNTSPSSGGTVTSVGLSLPSIFNVSGSPVTISGTLSGTLANETANTVFAGPTSGGAAAPTFRALVAADIPSGSGNYIQNGTSLQTANYNISGNGYIGGNVGIGTTSPGTKLDVAGGIRASGSIFSQYGTTGSMWANGDNHTGGGIDISDDGGFFDYNDAYITYNGSTGFKVSGNNGASSAGFLWVNGTMRLGNASAITGSMAWQNSTNANTVTINSGATATSYALTLPTAQATAAGQVLQNNGSGTLSWGSTKISIPLGKILGEYTNNYYWEYYNDGTGGVYSNGLPTTLSVQFANGYCGHSFGYTATSASTFSKYIGNVEVTSGSGYVVTVVVYKYTPPNNSSANMTGTLLGTVTFTCTTSGNNYNFTVPAGSGTTTAINAGDLIVPWFMVNSTTPYLWGQGSLELTIP